MKDKKIDFKEIGFLMIVAGVYTWYLFRTILLNPGKVMYEAYGDGAKNYFTYIYHTLFGKGFHFDGMQYPWGEHIVFTDNQPIIAYPLSYLNSVFHWSLQDVLSVMNVMTPLFFFISIICLYKFLKWLDVNPYLATAFALFISAMPPNFHRIFGHFGLSYTLNIILILFLLMKYRENQRLKYILGIVIINLVFTGFHVYNLAIGSVILIAFSISYLVLHTHSLKQKLKSIAPLLVAIAIGFLSLKLFFAFTDNVTDRPVNPWGILNYCTMPFQVFTSSFSDLGRAFAMTFGGQVGDSLNEGYAYIGFIPNLYCVFLIFNFFFYLSRKKHNYGFVSLSIHEKYLILTGLLSLTLSLGIPFVWKMDFLLELIPAFKQFRSLGRLAIIFYFCISIATVIRISILLKLLISREIKNVAIMVGGLVLFLWTTEIISYSKFVQPKADEAIAKYNDFFQDIPKDENNNPIIKKDTTHQCLIALPFFCVGSEKISLDADGIISQSAFAHSIANQLPLVNTMMSRASWSQTFSLMRLIGGEFSDKSSFTKLLNNKRISIMLHRNGICSKDELYLLTNADTIKQDENFSYYSLDWNKLIAKTTSKIDSLNKIPIEIFQNQGAIFNSFKKLNESNTFFNSQGLDVSKIDTLEIINDSLSILNTQEFEFSLWAKVQGDDYRMPYCNIKTYNTNKEQLKSEDVLFGKSTDIVDQWYRASLFFTLDSNAKYIRIVFHNEDKPSALMLGECQLRPENLLTVKESQDKKSRLYNNHKVRTNP